MHHFLCLQKIQGIHPRREKAIIHILHHETAFFSPHKTLILNQNFVRRIKDDKANWNFDVGVGKMQKFGLFILG